MTIDFAFLVKPPLDCIICPAINKPAFNQSTHNNFNKIKLANEGGNNILVLKETGQDDKN